MENLFVYITTILFIYSCAFIDYEHLRDNDFIEDHTSRVVQRFLFLLLISMYNYKLAFASAFLFAAVFDQQLNFLRGFDLLHLGNTAKWDKFFNKRKWLYVSVKVLCLIISIILYII